MNERTLGLLLIGFGFAAIVVGAAVATGLLGWFGRLPGDIRIESGNVRAYVPLMSMLLVSVVISVALALVRRFL